ncbi:hypothetical protein M0R04_13240 [Candidatus Dojkabacteria bacterium]|jgi:hypothetical protein|nr:hypothetical protein [Candidatus Dojkabacteria bacterium]
MLELTTLKQLVKLLKKTMREERKVKSLLEELVSQVILQNKTVFTVEEPITDIVNEPAKDIILEENGEIKESKVVEDINPTGL